MQQSLGVKKPAVFLMHRPAASQPLQLVFSVFQNSFVPKQTISMFFKDYRGFCHDVIQLLAFLNLLICVAILFRCKLAQ